MVPLFDILRQADVVYLDEIRKAQLYDKIWQAFGPCSSPCAASA